MKNLNFTLAVIASAVLSACGGGSGSSPPVAITGTAATGAPMANAPVFIKDARGQEPTGQNEAAGVAVVTTDANGDFTIPPACLTQAMMPP